MPYDAVAAIDHACAGMEILPDGRVLTIDKDPAFRDDEDGWERLAIECARLLTPYQSPTFRAVMVTPPPEAPSKKRSRWRSSTDATGRKC